MLKFSILIICAVVLLLSQQVLALDGDRKGFILGLGIGAQGTGYSSSASDGRLKDSFAYRANHDAEFTAGLSTDIKIGLGITSDFEIHYFNKAMWNTLKNSENDYLLNLHGVSGFGGTFFIPFGMSNTWPSAPFLSVGYGNAFWTVPQKDLFSPFEGNGYYIGIGYEFAQHVRLELDFLSGSAREKFGAESVTKNFKNIILSLSVMAY